MEQLGEYNLLSDEQRLALRSVIAAFNAHDAFRSQEAGGEESSSTLDLTRTDLMGILSCGHDHEDIYSATRNDFLSVAPSTRARLTPRRKFLH